RDSPLYPFLHSVISDPVKVDRREVAGVVHARFRLGESEELVGEMTRAHGRDVHARDFFADLGTEIASQQQLEMHLQPGERRAQLVRGIRQEALLYLGRLAQLLEEAVERLD